MIHIVVGKLFYCLDEQLRILDNYTTCASNSCTSRLFCTRMFRPTKSTDAESRYPYIRSLVTTLNSVDRPCSFVSGGQFLKAEIYFNKRKNSVSLFLLAPSYQLRCQKLIINFIIIYYLDHQPMHSNISYL